jgi:DNA-binding transcriptional LysR family regulator
LFLSLPNIVVAQEIKAGRLIRLLREWTPTEKDIYVVYPSDRHLSPKVRAFLDFVIEKVTPHPPWLLQN